MRSFNRGVPLILASGAMLITLACSSKIETNQNDASPAAQLPAPPSPQLSVQPTSSIPNLQAELLDHKNSTTAFAIGTFDFKNYTYELPRGWQNPDGSTEITLINGKVAPVETNTNDKMDDAAKAAAKAERRIGLSYVATKFFDVTGDGEDEAVVVLKIETGGSAIPQVAYVFTWKAGKPELIWPFRTGDRADGGLKNIFAENGLFVVELYGQDRFLLGQIETGKITDDVEQLCCPTNFTRSAYKWNGKNFLMQGKRLTFLIADPNAAPVENLGEKVNDPKKSKK
ncbi:MAG: hypothetical protein IPK98_02660 [Chloracidobacterium sp.]|nr:hypothetical protein [Chloracidobacterium sp.]